MDKVGVGADLVLFWRKDIRVELLSLSSNHIDAVIQGDGSAQTWRYTGFYGVADQNLRHLS